jgi:hypothetical protein
MHVSLASPIGALTALATLLPIAALLVFERRAGRLRSMLGLAQPVARDHALSAAALVAIGLLLALAAAQPVLARTTPQRVRADAQAYVVFDNSISMVAAQPNNGPTRLDRAKRLAERLRAALPGVPVGVASFSERVLPHLFPSADPAVFRTVVNESVQISEPLSPRTFSPGERGTDLGSLVDLGANGYFAPSAARRLIVVFTDGESVTSYPGTIAAAFGGPRPIRTIFVRVWDAADRIYFSDGRTDRNYRPDPTGERVLQGLAGALDGRVYSESQLQGIIRTARDDLGHGPTTPRGDQRSRTPLAPWLVLVAALPLGAVLRRRNL